MEVTGKKEVNAASRKTLHGHTRSPDQIRVPESFRQIEGMMSDDDPGLFAA
jgi:hypothetical protein